MRMLRISWFALFGVMLFAAAVPELRANPEWRPVQEFMRQIHPNAREMVNEIQPVLERYYQAVAAGDNEAALTQYGWEEIRASSMADARENALQGIGFVKRQIDANDGIRQVGIAAVFVKGWVNNFNAEIIIELEFNNGKRDLSAPIPIERDGGRITDPLRLKVETTGTKTSPLFVGMIEVAKVAEDYYLAARDGNTSRARELAYFGRLEAYEKPQAHAERLASSIGSIQTQAQANGGLEGIEVNITTAKAAAREMYMTRRKVMEVVPYVYVVNVVQKYANGKTDVQQQTFVFDEGQWKIIPPY